MKKAIACVIPLLLAGSFACKKPEPSPTPAPVIVPSTTTTMPAPVSVTAVTLGNAIGPDKKVVAASETFGPKDTIYASVDTMGTGHAKLRAVWTFVKGEKTAKVDETTVELDATGPTVNEFHVSKPSGWPKGDYRLEIFLGDTSTPAMTKTFKVA
jgi:hypothetical protein